MEKVSTLLPGQVGVEEETSCNTRETDFSRSRYKSKTLQNSLHMQASHEHRQVCFPLKPCINNSVTESTSFFSSPLGYISGKSCNCIYFLEGNREIKLPCTSLQLTIICASVPNSHLEDNYSVMSFQSLSGSFACFASQGSSDGKVLTYRAIPSLEPVNEVFHAIIQSFINLFSF